MIQVFVWTVDLLENKMGKGCQRLCLIEPSSKQKQSFETEQTGLQSIFPRTGTVTAFIGDLAKTSANNSRSHKSYKTSPHRHLKTSQDLRLSTIPSIIIPPLINSTAIETPLN
jgi:hypothetical protein